MTTREEIVAEARTWLRTPYTHAANVKGSGVDCAMLLVEVYREPRGPVAADYDPRPYAQHWYLHHDEERYLAGIMKHARQVVEPQPGDIALYRVGRCVSHGAIVIGEGLAIHAYAESRRVELASLDEIGRLRGLHLNSYWSVFP